MKLLVSLSSFLLLTVVVSVYDVHSFDPRVRGVEPFSMRKILPGNGFHFDSDSKRYYFEYRYLRFREVKDYCRDLNMTMIHIRNWKENLFVRELDNRNLIPIGIEFKDGRWMWSDGSELAYTNWEDWEPRCGSFCVLNTMYMKLDGRWIVDQEGIGIVACETSLPERERLADEPTFRREIIHTLTDIRDTLIGIRSVVKSRSGVPSSGGSGYEQNQLPTIVVPLRGGGNVTRINP